MSFGSQLPGNWQYRVDGHWESAVQNVWEHWKSDVSHDGAVVAVVLVVVMVDVVVVGHGPQSNVPPHPSDTIPHCAPHWVVRVQHTPNGLEPGGAPLTHAPLQHD
jgi:hypothetical protein